MITATKNECGTVSTCFLMVLIYLSFSAFFQICHADEKKLVNIYRFSEGEGNNWETKVFAGESTYQLVKVDGQVVLEGEAKASASGILKNVVVDLAQTPFLNWSWRIEKAHPPLEERTKSGDDYAARIYIVVDGGLFFWQTIALNYVWSSSQPPGSIWPSSYAGDNVMLMALRSKNHPLSTWYREKRNVYEDFKRLFGKEIDHIDAVAIMTDSDDSGGEVRAYYGDIYFSKE